MLGQSRLLKGYALGPKRKTNVIVHRLSLRQCSFANWWTAFLLVSLPPLALSLFAQVANDTVLNEPQWAPPPTFSACNAVDCVIGPAEAKLQTRITSRKSKDKYWIRAGLSHKRRQTEGEREPGWKSSKLGQRTKREPDHPFWKSETGGCKPRWPSPCTVHGGCHGTELFGVYLIMPCRPRPSVSNLTLRLITV